MLLYVFPIFSLTLSPLLLLFLWKAIFPVIISLEVFFFLFFSSCLLWFGISFSSFLSLFLSSRCLFLPSSSKCGKNLAWRRSHCNWSDLLSVLIEKREKPNSSSQASLPAKDLALPMAGRNAPFIFPEREAEFPKVWFTAMSIEFTWVSLMLTGFPVWESLVMDVTPFSKHFLWFEGEAELIWVDFGGWKAWGLIHLPKVRGNRLRAGGRVCHAA